MSLFLSRARVLFRRVRCVRALCSQMAPSRGNLDAINVHPFEMIPGEWNHLFSLWLINAAGLPVHIATVLVFLLCSGIFASLNHTRADVRISIGPIPIYSVRAHDVHHW